MCLHYTHIFFCLSSRILRTTTHTHAHKNHQHRTANAREMQKSNCLCITPSNGEPFTFTIPDNTQFVGPQQKKASLPKGKIWLELDIAYLITPNKIVIPMVEVKTLAHLARVFEHIDKDAIESGWYTPAKKTWVPFTDALKLYKITHSSCDDTKERKQLQEKCFGRVHKDGRVSPPKTEKIKAGFADIVLSNKSDEWFKECTKLDDTNIEEKFPRLNKFIRGIAKPLPPYKKLDTVLAELTEGAARDSDDDDDDDSKDGDDSKHGEKNKKKKGDNGGNGDMGKKPKPTINKKSSKEEKGNVDIVLKGFGHPKNVQGKKKTLHWLATCAINAALEQGRVEM